MRFLLLAIVASCLAGCGSIELKGDRGETNPKPMPAAWPFWPKDIRVHPFTSVDRGEGAPVLVTHLTFLDPVGDPTKAVGRLTFELRGRGKKGRLIHRWRVEMTDIDDTRDHYDSVTNTYVFGLKLERPLPETPLTMTVRLVDPRGEHITATADVPVRGEKAKEKKPPQKAEPAEPEGGAGEPRMTEPVAATGQRSQSTSTWTDLLTAPLDLFKPLVDLFEE